MKAVKCACCGGSMKKERQDLVGGPEMEVRRARRFGHRALRRRGRPPRGVPVVVAVEGLRGSMPGAGRDFQAQDLGVLGGLAHARARRGAPPRPFRRRDPGSRSAWSC